MEKHQHQFVQVLSVSYGYLNMLAQTDTLQNCHEMSPILVWILTVICLCWMGHPMQQQFLTRAGGRGTAGGNPDGTNVFIQMTHFGSSALQAFTHPSRKPDRTAGCTGWSGEDCNCWSITFFSVTLRTQTPGDLSGCLTAVTILES